MLSRDAFVMVRHLCGCKLASSSQLLPYVVQHSKCFNRRYSSKCQPDNDYDVVVAGGGMVGGTMACALGKSSRMQGKKLLLLEASPPTSTDILKNVPKYHSNRVCSISPGNVEFLDSLNIWEKIPRSTSVKKMQVWDACSDAVISFDKNNMTEDLCRITENSLLVAAVTEVLKSDLESSVEIQYGKKIKSCHFPKPYVEGNDESPTLHTTVTLEDGSTLTTKLLIAADGANSTVVKQSGISLYKWNYDQSGVVATLKLSEPCENVVAWQRFLPTGPIALLPLNDETSSLVWSTSHEHCRILVEMEEDAFVSEINTAFWQNYPQNEIVGRMKDFLQTFLPENGSVLQYPPSMCGIAGKQQRFPLGFAHANQYVKTGLAVIGDACHRIHPLAGQGVNLGLRDVSCLIKVLNNATYDGEYIGSLEYLLDYERERQQSNFAISAAVDGLKHLYSTDNSAAVALRTCGLMFTNAMDPLKTFFMEEAIK